MKKIEQYDIWLLNFDPSVGQEIRKTRPALVISNSYYNMASGTIFVVPLGSQKPKHSNSPFYIAVEKDEKNALKKTSYLNISQLRAVSKLRFVKKTGKVKEEILQEISKRFLEILDVDILALRYFKN